MEPDLRRRMLRACLGVAAVAVAALATDGAAGARPAPAAGDAAAGPDRRAGALSRVANLRRPAVRRQRRDRSAGPRPLVFGIYPGGAAGTVGPAGQVKPEVPELRRQALQTLRGGADRFVLHLYDSFTRRSDAGALPAWLAEQLDAYAADGFELELVLTYRPQDLGGDAEGFVDFVRARVRQLGPRRAVTHLQVTNEVNVTVAPDAADGAYAGARDALVDGVIAAKNEARRGGFGHLAVGFNWANQVGRSETAFFSALRAKGGAAFADAVDWVGVDAYPGTWGPALPSGDLAAAVRSSTLRTLRTVRRTLLPRAGLARAALHFSESGYPTGPGRTEAMQQTVMRSVIRTLAETRETYGVEGFRWFDLRDADSANPSFESQYGLTRDDYSPKAAFWGYRDLVTTLG